MGKKLPAESKLSKKKLKYEKIGSTEPTVSKKYLEYLKKSGKKYVTTKQNILNKLKVVKNNLATVVVKIKKLKKTTKKTTKISTKTMKTQRIRAIIGICHLFVVVSIAYSSVITFLGVDSTVSKIALIPQALFALIILVKSFSKLYK